MGIIQFSENEEKLLNLILCNEVKNANSVNPKAYNVSSSEYKTLCVIINKINFKNERT